MKDNKDFACKVDTAEIKRGILVSLAGTEEYYNFRVGLACGYKTLTIDWNCTGN